MAGIGREQVMALTNAYHGAPSGECPKQPPQAPREQPHRDALRASITDTDAHNASVMAQRHSAQLAWARGWAGGAPEPKNPSSPLQRRPKQPHAAARQEPDLAYGEAAGLKRGRVRPPRELVYAAEASPGSRGTIIAAIFSRCPAQRTLLTFGLFNATPDMQK